MSSVCSHCTENVSVAGVERTTQAERVRVHARGLYGEKLEFKLSRLKATKGLLGSECHGIMQGFFLLP